MPRMSGGRFRQLSFCSQQTRLKTESNGMAKFCLASARWTRDSFICAGMRWIKRVSVFVTIIMWLSWFTLFTFNHVALFRHEEDIKKVSVSLICTLNLIFFINIVLDVKNNIFFQLQHIILISLNIRMWVSYRFIFLFVELAVRGRQPDIYIISSTYTLIILLKRYAS